MRPCVSPAPVPPWEWGARRLLFVSLLLLLTVLTARSSMGDFAVPGNVLFSRSGYDYAPSIIEGNGVQKFWWCGFGTVPGSTFQTDVIFYRSWNSGTGQWSGISTVLWPTSGRWDGFYT